VITRAHVLAWTIAALSGGALACETKPAEAGTPPTSELPAGVDYFRHNGNDCYFYSTVTGHTAALACTRAP
jgi:hypothetical protein